jgi:predicted O-linked N-acetylglucosamine transferase (SPINDLY family)
MYETDKLDILVDLDGFGVPHFRMLFAVQAAPIQISFLGWPATTGSCPTRLRIACGVHSLFICSILLSHFLCHV